jgi:hypothetical protein
MRVNLFNKRLFAKVEKINHLCKPVFELVNRILRIGMLLNDSLQYRVFSRINHFIERKTEKIAIEVNYSQKDYRSIEAVSAEITFLIKNQNLLKILST